MAIDEHRETTYLEHRSRYHMMACRLKILTKIEPKNFRQIEAIGPKDTQQSGVNVAFFV